MIKKLIHNALDDLLTSFAGSLAGVEDLIQGITEKNFSKAIKGGAIIFLGLISNTNHTKTR